MIRAVFIRHGEAEPEQGARSDHQRKLTPFGRQFMARQAKALKAKNIVPDILIASDSQRTRETAEILRAELGPCPEVLSRELYLCGYDQLCEVADGLERTAGTFIFVGHNPGWSEIAGLLVNKPLSLAPGDFIICTYDGELPLAAALAEIGAWQALT